jgi:excinuclease ABC subunit A
MEDKIKVTGARTHNLKNISVEMPRNKMVVVTGLSGSGKSSLAFDTIFAEGQRRYVESLSSYARQFLDQMQKPDVDEITGLSPAISIDQKTGSRNPRSTVATITEIYDYLRVLYARVGTPYSPVSGEPIVRLTNEEIKNIIIDKITQLDNKDDGLVKIYAPIVRGRKGEYYQMLYDLLGKGYSNVLIDGHEQSLRDQIILDKKKTHNIDLFIDAVDVSEFHSDQKFAEERLSEAIENALNEADGLVRVVFPGDEMPQRTAREGEELSDDEKGPEQARYGSLFSTSFTDPYSGYSFPEVEPRLFSFNSPYGACPICRGLGTKHFKGTEPCATCGGARLREEALYVFLHHEKGGRSNIADFVAMSVEDAEEWLIGLKLNEKNAEIAEPILREIEERLKFMSNVGIEYLTLDRRANTLSGGEAQRIRLASQLGSKLVGALYVLDEPTIGLHQRDNDRLIKTLLDLRDLGNTILVVEHDEDTIAAADYLIDIGPGAGRHGGEVIVADDLNKLMDAETNTSDSLTLSYLRGEVEIPIPDKRRSSTKGAIKVVGANKHNLENVNLEIPLGRFVCVTGVSGSGKSTMLYDVVEKNLKRSLDRRDKSTEVINAAKFSGSEYMSRMVTIDQSPIGRTSRSNPATYTGAFNHIRDLFASTSEAKVRGWSVGRFSFNVKGGRCEACQGKGVQAIEMHFLPTVYVPCDVCGGKRYQSETLEVTYKNKNIYDVLEMTIEEALEFFNDIPAIHDRLRVLDQTGLGYLKLGQSATTLSGGEAQRIKISSELYRRHTEKTIYLLDEPTVGLHYEDVRKLIQILDKLVQQGNTVVVIEHNLDLIKCADYVIDMGPEGGKNGGQVIATGTPEEVADTDGSYTGKYLSKMLSKSKSRKIKAKK